MSYQTGSLLGVDLDRTTTTAEFALGTTVAVTDGGEAVYVQASGAITQFDAVAIDENYQAAALTKALADAGHDIGAAQVAFTDDHFGWVHKNGTNISIRCAAACEPDVALYTTGNAGILDDTSASQTKISGLVAVTTASSGVTSLEVIMTYPVADQPE